MTKNVKNRSFIFSLIQPIQERLNLGVVDMALLVLLHSKSCEKPHILVLIECIRSFDEDCAALRRCLEWKFYYLHLDLYYLSSTAHIC